MSIEMRLERSGFDTVVIALLTVNACLVIGCSASKPIETKRGNVIFESEDPIGRLCFTDSAKTGVVTTFKYNRSPVVRGDAATSSSIFLLHRDDGYAAEKILDIPGRLVQILSLAGDGSGMQYLGSDQWLCFWSFTDKTVARLREFNSESDLGGFEAVCFAETAKTRAHLECIQEPDLRWYHRITVIQREPLSEKSWIVREGFLHSMAMSPNGELVAISSQDGDVIVYQSSDGSEKLRLSCLPRTLNSNGRVVTDTLVFSKDAKFLAAAGKYGFHVWRLDTGETVSSVEGDSLHLEGIVFSRDLLSVIACEFATGPDGNKREAVGIGKWSIESQPATPTGKMKLDFKVAQLLDGGEKVAAVMRAARNKVILKSVSFVKQ
jgi:WD40 repeat protein